MNAEQFLQFVRTVDPDPYVNREIMSVAVISYFNESGQQVVALATKDGRHRIVMLDEQFEVYDLSVRDGYDGPAMDRPFQAEVQRADGFEATVRGFMDDKSEDDLRRLWSAFQGAAA